MSLLACAWTLNRAEYSKYQWNKAKMYMQTNWNSLTPTKTATDNRADSEQLCMVWHTRWLITILYAGNQHWVSCNSVGFNNTGFIAKERLICALLDFTILSLVSHSIAQNVPSQFPVLLLLNFYSSWILWFPCAYRIAFPFPPQQHPEIGSHQLDGNVIVNYLLYFIMTKQHFMMQ